MFVVQIFVKMHQKYLWRVCCLLNDVFEGCVGQVTRIWHNELGISCCVPILGLSRHCGV